ncbi:MAG: class I SAM-dependent methyltransferase [Gammaproteobacteria bacterium]|nr:MAG: class I SAM-dependent methyltransferase [Gammaproteobacteria bacterium]
MNARVRRKKKAGARRATRDRDTLAARADRYRLYERAVQDTAFEYAFLNRTYRALRGRTPRILREDFCGPAPMCCAWARRHNLARLTPDQRARLRLIRADVREAATDTAPDLVIAMNFSYQVFTTRDALRAYFRAVRESLAEDGLFVLDAYGGYDAYREIEEETEHEDFTYVWDQHRYDPVTGKLTCYIHFHFPDGSKLRRAFVYHWRLWTLPELQEILREAGFRRVTVYWQGTDAAGEPDGDFRPVRRGEADAGWIAYLSAEP